MSHRGAHNWAAWTTEETVNSAGEREFRFVRYCTVPRCGASDEQRGAIVEPRSYYYARTLEEHSEPDD